MTVEVFTGLLAQVVSIIGETPPGSALADRLGRDIGAGSPLFSDIEAACHKGIDDGWLCNREAGGIAFGRVIKPGGALGDYSVDVVRMKDLKGPHHVHPNGEIDMIMPLDSGAEFDGHGRGWCVYGPGSAHWPTVTGGAAIVLYLLPGGAIEFTGK